MTNRARIIGSYLSPYVRKVLVFLDLKGLPYEIDPIIPFMGDERFSKLSPVRRIPVFSDDQVTLADSSVICQYLEDRHPTPALYPTDIAERARARWLEEFADTRMGEVLIWHLFNEVAIKPFVWGEPPDQEALQRTLNTEIPAVLDYLETQVPRDGFVFGSVSIADISIATFFRNAAFARFRIDAARWPRPRPRRFQEAGAFRRAAGADANPRAPTGAGRDGSAAFARDLWYGRSAPRRHAHLARRRAIGAETRTARPASWA
jgi:glutathione S-transferase